VVRSLGCDHAQFVAEPLHLDRVAQRSGRQIEMRVAVADKGHDPHESDQHFITIQARDGGVQARYFSLEGFATNRVENVGVAAGQFAREIVKIFAPRA
jgi:methylmalonyl-CoA mutase cobalamin-binding subunit